MDRGNNGQTVRGTVNISVLTESTNQARRCDTLGLWDM